jgi:hypothetical protein
MLCVIAVAIYMYIYRVSEKSRTNGNLTYYLLFTLYALYVLRSSRQTFWLHIQRSRVRLPALPDFLRSGGSGMGASQPPEDN